jgi:hypothetical protein
MTKIQNSKTVSVIWYWNLRFVCNLVLGDWNFYYSVPTKALVIFTSKAIEYLT